MHVTFDDVAWESVDAGTEALVERWLVDEGAHVSAGQLLAEIVLVKAVVEIASPADGVLTQILVPAQGTFGRGAPLAVLDVDTPA